MEEYKGKKEYRFKEKGQFSLNQMFAFIAFIGIG